MKMKRKIETQKSVIKKYKKMIESDGQVTVKKEQGITLIALVVTIIIMLILAGVALTMALGENGLIQMSKSSASKYEEAGINEEKNLGGTSGYLWGVSRYQMDNMVLLLSGELNVGGKHSNATDTWYDISGVSGKNAIKSTEGMSEWNAKSLYLNGNTGFTVGAPVEDSFGTVEVCVKIDKEFKPVDAQWFRASTIFGYELGGYQKDWAITMNKDGCFTVSYTGDNTYTSKVSALDGNIHTVTYSYLPDKMVFAVDGKVETTKENKPGENPCTEFGIGWNPGGGPQTKIKGEIYCVRFYKGELTEQDIEKNYEADKKSFE